ncbi:hypothetical protein SBOR_6124 [Sclerotinia borealis F-4128]|uniref:Uncharacterized protein n=1 Tax=Sclerotinia borealis (strain F-4128) TaxID=1432307 RepID=W9CG03_SCLBF|nr:hypothetical protein SBOR_6124 [Sclerotinia borealis F-4128]
MAARTQMLEMVRFHRHLDKRRETEEITKFDNGHGWSYIEKYLEHQCEPRNFYLEKDDHIKTIFPVREDETQKTILENCSRTAPENSSIHRNLAGRISGSNGSISMINKRRHLAVYGRKFEPVISKHFVAYGLT